VIVGQDRRGGQAEVGTHSQDHQLAQEGSGCPKGRDAQCHQRADCSRGGRGAIKEAAQLQALRSGETQERGPFPA
jgi:hypothetical protein